MKTRQQTKKLEEMKTKVVIVMGPPGTGKGTQCKLLCEKYGYVHFSTGDLCREYGKKNNKLGREIKAHMDKGNFVPDEFITKLINEKVQEPDVHNKIVLLDGYPRTFEQANGLLSNDNVSVEKMLLIQTSDNACVERILNRRTDPETGKIYNMKFLKPDDINIINRLEKRENELDESFVRNRLKKYYQNLGSIVPLFKGKIFAVNGEQDIDMVLNDMEQCITANISATNNKSTKTNVRKTKKVKVLEQCVVCMSNPSDFLIVPCGHKCGCEECLTNIKNRGGECPICRTNITDIVKVFNSGVVEDNAPTNDEDVDGECDQDIVPMEIDDGNDDGGWAIADFDWKNQQNGGDINMLLKNSIKIIASPCENPSKEKRFIDVAININVPDIVERIPIDVCCVIDISGSMADSAKFQDPNDETKTISEGVTILDLVKHAVKTVIGTLTEKDSLSIVSFDGVGQIAFSLHEMNDQGKENAVNALKLLQPRGNTNIWAGLECGLESLRTGKPKLKKKQYVLLLTDGQPNQSPPKGEHTSLKTYMETYPDFKCQVNTFGFGYSLRSQLLLDIAVEGGGTFSFIPDAKIVGTCFVNAIANSSCTVIQKCSLHLTEKNGNRIGQNKFNKTPWGYIADIGPLHFGQTRNIIVPVEMDSNSEGGYLDVVLEFDENKIEFTATEKTVKQESISAQIRAKVVDTVYAVIDGSSKGNGLQMLMKARELSGYVTALSQLHSMDPDIVGISADVSGRILKAISTTERFNRWGQHYLRSVTRGHDLQICTNFMDMGLQAYGDGTLFKDLVHTGGEIFKTMPLEKTHQYNQPQYNQPQYNQQHNQQYYQQQSNQPQQASAQTYYAGSGGGCFDESVELLVKRDDKTPFIKVKISDVRRGDKVIAMPDTSFWCNIIGRKSVEATVKHLVKIDCGNVRKMVKFLDSGIILTGSHPIRLNGKWEKPKNLVDGVTIVNVDSTSRYVYNLVLDTTKVGLLIGGSECVTFGHQFTDAWHPLYASDVILRVIEEESKKQENSNVVNITSVFLKDIMNTN